MKTKSLREIADEVRATGKKRALMAEEASRFQDEFNQEITPVITKIREQERRAYEEARNFTLA